MRGPLASTFLYAAGFCSGTPAGCLPRQLATLDSFAPFRAVGLRRPLRVWLRSTAPRAASPTSRRTVLSPRPREPGNAKGTQPKSRSPQSFAALGQRSFRATPSLPGSTVPRTRAQSTGATPEIPGAASKGLRRVRVEFRSSSSEASSRDALSFELGSSDPGAPQGALPPSAVGSKRPRWKSRPGRYHDPSLQSRCTRLQSAPASPRSRPCALNRTNPEPDP